MRLSTFLRAFTCSFLRPVRDLRPTADAIAQRCRKATGRRVRNTLGVMTVPESKGYVRARSGDLICQQVTEAILASGRAELDRVELTRRATDVLIAMVLHDWQTSKPVHNSRRAA